MDILVLTRLDDINDVFAILDNTFTKNFPLRFSSFKLLLYVHRAEFQVVKIMLSTVLDRTISRLSRFDVRVVPFEIKSTRVSDVHLFSVLDVSVEVFVTILMMFLAHNTFLDRTYSVKEVPKYLSFKRALGICQQEGLSRHIKFRLLRRIGRILRSNISIHYAKSCGPFLIHIKTSFTDKNYYRNQTREEVPLVPL